MPKVTSLAHANDLWPAVLSDFKRDGALRDINVPETDVADWDDVLRALSATGWPLKALVGDKRPEEPLSFDVMFGYRQDQPVLLSVFADGIQLNCHFFEPEKIEFDLEPGQVTAENFPVLCRFMSMLSAATGKACLLSMENVSFVSPPILSVDARLDRIVAHMTD